jgi:hypothetical protein
MHGATSTRSRAELRRELERRGAVVVPAVLEAAAREALWQSICPETAAGAVRTGSRDPYGARGLLTARPELKRLLTVLGLDALAERALGVAAFPIDAVFFDKRPDVNWAVPAHQDLVVPIPAAAEVDTVRRTRERDGLRYGEPADHVLGELVALRVHFDAASASHGGLAIACGSHTRGRLSSDEILQLPAHAFQPLDCHAGDVLLMKPLAVHRSPRSSAPARRRVLHLLYAPRDGWHDRASRAA